jgi:5'-deoxynucleotidase YfbR-like HD superfamily hydrolase
MTPWLASFTRRWHANEFLCHTVDPVAAHSGRMGILALTLWGAGASRELLVACLAHDLGEHATGDVPCDAKADGTLSAALDRLEDAALHRMGMSYSLSLDDARRLKLLDRLDAYLWAEHHAPHVLQRPDWVAAWQWLQTEAAALQVELPE